MDKIYLWSKYELQQINGVTNRSISKFYSHPIQINGSNIIFVVTVKYLGLILNSQLNWLRCFVITGCHSVLHQLIFENFIRKYCNKPLRDPLSRITEREEGMREAFSDARRGSRKGLRTSRCIDVGVTLENYIKRLSL